MNLPELPNDVILEIMVNTHPYIVRRDLSNLNNQYNNVYNRMIKVKVEGIETSIKEWRYLQTLKRIGNFSAVSLLTDLAYSSLYNLLYPIPEFPYIEKPANEYVNKNLYRDVVYMVPDQNGGMGNINIIHPSAKEKNILRYIDYNLHNIKRGCELNYSEIEIQEFIDKITESSNNLSFGQYYGIDRKICYVKNEYGVVDNSCPFSYEDYERSLMKGKANQIEGINVTHNIDDNTITINYKDIWNVTIGMSRLYYIIGNADFPKLVVNKFINILNNDSLFKLAYYESVQSIMNYFNNDTVRYEEWDDESDEPSPMYKFIENLEFIIAIYCTREKFDVSVFGNMMAIYMKNTNIYNNDADDDYPSYLPQYIFTLNNRDVFYIFYTIPTFQQYLSELGPIIYDRGINECYLWNSIPWIFDICYHVNSFDKNSIPLYHRLINDILMKRGGLYMHIIVFALKSNDLEVLNDVLNNLY
ncbi:Hypothetical protein ORPV_309 [Orpheovirus IHUMI-LCC2]|uniref:Uncharacterized protein n=1 Tax=Orpheovirus IHUMI-LCC2 TaxID=2023057 RepID=A0A2I2L3W1_9VIRU|nr:Hypothetical protein ORPV_309 [Orpheovirus IHUMI-LCC2]SNW62213.1 Hypothetical protein ORPV_309 [Orpheovirus IHUMI-LCC2]